MIKLNSDDYKTNVRKAWSSQVTDDIKLKLKLLPQTERFALYSDCDKRTTEIYVNSIKKYRGQNSDLNLHQILLESGFIVAQSIME